MKSKLFCTYLLCVLSLGLFACSPKAVETPQEEAPISEPPVYVAPPKVENRYDAEFRTRLADKRYFGAAVPFGYEELGCSESGCRIATYMSLSDVLKFVEYYFPYQVIEILRNDELIHITKNIRAPFLDGGVLPVLDVHQVRPLAGLEIDVRISWNREASRYEWQYSDPKYIEPVYETGPNDVMPDDGLSEVKGSVSDSEQAVLGNVESPAKEGSLQ